MVNLPGIERPGVQALPQIKDRLTFLYLEYCTLNRHDGALTITDAKGVVHVPGANIGVLMLGPGTSVSHRAMELLGDAGASIIWVGEQGVRVYASGRPLAQSSSLLIRQAALVSTPRSRLAVARRMYQMRFPSEDVCKLTMQQLRGKEGARVRAIYKRVSEQTGVPWVGRQYDPENFEGGSSVNQALSAAHVCLYGICHCVIAALGLAPGLGFVHTGNARSFVYDIADLYKAECTIPLAFQCASGNSVDVAGNTRRAVRDYLAKTHLLERIVADIYTLLEGEPMQSEAGARVISLWDEYEGSVAGGVLYASREDEVLDAARLDTDSVQEA